jgi:hypothetical protein
MMLRILPRGIPRCNCIEMDLCEIREARMRAGQGASNNPRRECRADGIGVREAPQRIREEKVERLRWLSGTIDGIVGRPEMA